MEKSTSVNLEENAQLIDKWAEDKGLTNGNPWQQYAKLNEEIGELAQGMLKNNREQVLDSLGDTFVVLEILASQLDTDLGMCVAMAYNTIANRTGEMHNGVFVKTEDLNND